MIVLRFEIELGVAVQKGGMKAIDWEIELFVESWEAEISRAIEIFTGVKPQVSCRPEVQTDLNEMNISDYLWWQQAFEAERSLTISIGAQEPAWIALGGGGEPDERCKQTYFDILRQAHDGVAGTLGTRTGKAFRCAAGLSRIPEILQGVPVFVAEIRLGSSSDVRVELLLGVRTSAENRVANWEPDERRRRPRDPILGPLTDVELPLAVSLGRASMPIREILKITPGSLIELDRTVKDYVDLIMHGVVVARGEIVSIRGNYGVRIKQIITRDDRMALRAGHQPT